MTTKPLSPRARSLTRLRVLFRELFKSVGADMHAYFFTGYRVKASDSAVALHRKILAARLDLTDAEKRLLDSQLLQPTEYVADRQFDGKPA